jgi:predicted HTH transcriptional regulator
MPRAERALQLAPSQSEQPRVRPVPPDDLWDQLAALNEQVCVETPRQPGSFTTSEYAERFGISEPTALRRIQKMIKAGDVLKHGASAKVFYTVVQR